MWCLFSVVIEHYDAWHRTPRVRRVTCVCVFIQSARGVCAIRCERFARHKTSSQNGCTFSGHLTERHVPALETPKRSRNYYTLPSNGLRNKTHTFGWRHGRNVFCLGFLRCARNTRNAISMWVVWDVCHHVLWSLGLPYTIQFAFTASGNDFRAPKNPFPNTDTR